MSRWPAYLPHPAILFVGLAWGMNFVVLKLAYREFSPATLGLLRYLAMVPLLFLVARAMGAPEFRVPKGEAWKFALGGFLSSGLYMVLFLEGTKRVPAAQGAIILATVPLWIGLFAILTRQERFRWPLLWAFVVSYAGVGMVALGGGREVTGTTWGILLTLASAVVWGYSVIVMNPLLTGRSAVSVFAWALPWAGLILVPYGIGDLFSTDYGAISATGWFSLGYLVLIAGVASFVLYYVGVQRVGPSQAAMIQYLVPVVTAVGQFFVLGIMMTGMQILGIAVVLAGVMVANRLGRRPLAQDPAHAEAGTG